MNKFKALYEYGQFSVLLHNLDSVISKVEAAVKLQVTWILSSISAWIGTDAFSALDFDRRIETWRRTYFRRSC